MKQSDPVLLDEEGLDDIHVLVHLSRATPEVDLGVALREAKRKSEEFAEAHKVTRELLNQQIRL